MRTRAGFAARRGLRRKIAVALVAACCLLAGSSIAQSATAPGGAKQLWQLLDYVAADYDGAVTGGKVVSQGEYGEMLDFTEQAGRQVQMLPPHPSREQIANAVGDLHDAVLRKADGAEVARLAHRAIALLIAAYPIPLTPTTLPDLAHGASLYATHCAACHGTGGRGDGPLASTLNPRPIAFTDSARARVRSLLALYQAISQGVNGTAMASFADLSEKDRWALAFFVGTMADDDAMRIRGAQIWKTDPAIRQWFPDLAAVTTTTESGAAQSMPADVARDVTAYLRAHPGIVEAGKPAGTALARLRLKESLAALHDGDRTSAGRLGLSAYLDGFEPLEPVVGARNRSLLAAVEDAMLAYRSAVARGATAQAEGAAAHLDSLFSQVDDVMQSSRSDPTTTFVGALTILLREGAEALLIVVGMIAYLKKADRSDGLRSVHAGWASALVAGALTWAGATYLVRISGASREVTEGVGSLLAAAVLLSVGLWMHSRSSAGRWQHYLHEKLSGAMTRRSAWALFALAFVAVYREVFETVLFYSALAADGSGKALAAGFVAALALLALIAWALLRTSARMPVGKFFSFTSVLVAILAVVLAGQGVSALQEAGWLRATPASLPRVEWLGLYPTLETMIAQVVVAWVALAGFGMNVLKARTGRGTGRA